MKFPLFVLRYCIHPVSGSLPAVTLTFNLLTPKSNQHIYEPKHISDQNWVNFPSLVFEIWCSEGFRVAWTQALTHSRTDRSDYRMPPAPFFNGGEGITIQNCFIEQVRIENNLGIPQ